MPPFRVCLCEHNRPLDPPEFDLLDEEEKRHCARLARESDRRAFAQTRLALRNLLGAAGGLPPKDIKFRRNSWGKLSLAPAPTSAIDFSVSHAKGLSVIAISDGRPIGIDIESVRDVPDRLRVTADILGQDVARQLHGTPVGFQDVLFLQLWTAAEAFVKAQGVGFAGWGGKVPLRLSEGRSPQVRFCDGHSANVTTGWTLTPLLLPPGFVGNVVAGRSPKQHAGHHAQNACSTGCG
jgi:phosphopantetheinyl transferase